MFTKNTRIVITGGAGFVGSRVIKNLRQQGFSNLFVPRSHDYDLRKAAVCKKVVDHADVVIHLAANVGGIGYNRNFPATLFYDNLIMGLNMLHESFVAGVKKFVALGTVCAYPKYTPAPFREEDFWDGYPEETNAPYGLAKKMLLVGAQAYRMQHGFNSIYLIPVNIYGPGDNFDPQQSHVIPALIRKFHEAKIKHYPSVIVWGTGTASREFLYVDDAARAIVLAMKKYDKPAPVNLGSGQEILIRDLVKSIANIIKYRGQIVWDKTKPDGQPRRLLNTDLAAKEFGFRATTNFDKGLKYTIAWYTQKYGK